MDDLDAVSAKASPPAMRRILRGTPQGPGGRSPRSASRRSVAATPDMLISAIDNKNVREVKNLLEARCPADQLSTDGRLALHAAVESNEEDIVQALLDKKVALDQKEQMLQQTALHRATLINHHVVKLLLGAGADANATDKNMSTPLHVAAEMNKFKSARALLAAGADPSAVDEGGQTPLHRAMTLDHELVVLELLPKMTKEQRNLGDKSGFTAVNLASANGHSGLVRTYENFVDQEASSGLVEDELQEEAEEEMAQMSEAFSALIDGKHNGAAGEGEEEAA